VVDWQAPAATPFYRATVSDPMDLTRRRRFSVKGPQLIDIFDELFDDPDSLLAGAHTVPDLLLAELSRARTGEMRDIVATIQAEPDVIIRTPLNRLVVVQRGPGTGKTAGGLHRAAFLLYEHRTKLERDTVLVVGPNDLFLRYVSQVLPSLGETAVLQTTIQGLFSTTIR
jgi:DNA helicase IV